MAYTTLQKHLLNDFQRDFPLTAAPYRSIAETLGVEEETVLRNLDWLIEHQAVSRVGAVFAPNRIGASTLVAMAVPEGRLAPIAAFVNTYSEVNHNYERDHHFNLWFVVTAGDSNRLQEILMQIEETTGLPVMSLPLLEEFHIDLAFPLRWDECP